MPPKLVEICVSDKATGGAESFECDLSLLRSTMTYFEPLIKKQLLERQQSVKGSRDPSPISLKVNCDLAIFRWLLTWTESAGKPSLSAANAVSILLSSCFLGMRELTESALGYIRDHLAEVLLSGVDMACVPGDLLGRLCAITTEASIANCLHALYSKGEARHPNRGFVAALLRHWVCDQLALTPAAPAASGSSSFHNRQLSNSSSNSPNAAIVSASTAVDIFSKAPRPPLPPPMPRSSSAADPRADDNGLRWCRGCGLLYDHRELARLLAGDGAALSSPQMTKEPLCRACGGPGATTSTTGGVGAGAGGGGGGGGSATARRTAPRVGSRGEKLTTHAPSRLLPFSPTPPSASGRRDSTSASGGGSSAGAAAVARAALEVPAYKGGGTGATPHRQDLVVERWAWRLIGVTRFAVCRRCRRLLPLIDVARHNCSSNNLPCEFVPAERFGSAGSTVAMDMQNLIRWFQFAAEERVYGDVGELKPIVCPVAALAAMEAETIAVPSAATLSGVGAAAIDNGAVPDDKDNKDDAGEIDGGQGAQQHHDPRSWVEFPAAVVEATAVAAPYARPVASSRERCLVDVDVINFFEREFLHSIEAVLVAMHRAAVKSSADDAATATTTVSGGCCPRLLPYPHVAGPQLSGSPLSGLSPRPSTASSLVAYTGGGAGRVGPATSRHTGAGSLVLGGAGKIPKPNNKRRK